MNRLIVEPYRQDEVVSRVRDTVCAFPRCDRPSANGNGRCGSGARTQRVIGQDPGVGDLLVRFGSAKIVTQPEEQGVQLELLHLNPPDMSPRARWHLFAFEAIELLGIAPYQGTQTHDVKYCTDFRVSQICDIIKLDGRMSFGRLDALASWLDMAPECASRRIVAITRCGNRLIVARSASRT